jgi:hypothetical protein
VPANVSVWPRNVTVDTSGWLDESYVSKNAVLGRSLLCVRGFDIPGWVANE